MTNPNSLGNQTIAKTDDITKHLQELTHKSHEQHETGDATRKVGKLYGFPKTKTEYYIKLNLGEVQDNQTNKVDEYNYGEYIHDPNNYYSEYMAYDDKINPCFEKYCPESTHECRVINHKFSRA